MTVFLGLLRMIGSPEGRPWCPVDRRSDGEHRSDPQGPLGRERAARSEGATSAQMAEEFASWGQEHMEARVVMIGEHTRLECFEGIANVARCIKKGGE